MDKAPRLLSQNCQNFPLFIIFAREKSADLVANKKDKVFLHCAPHFLYVCSLIGSVGVSSAFIYDFLLIALNVVILI